MGLIFIVGVIVLIWMLFDHGHHYGHGHRYGYYHHHHHAMNAAATITRTPRQILDERYAQGEIDRQEYLDRRKDIEI